MTTAVLSALLAMTLSACAVGPDYQRPETAAPAAYKEMTGWKQAQPQSVDLRPDWWIMFNDPVLNDLVARVNINNQNVALAAAQYREALASAASARSGLFPTLGVNASATRSQSRSGSSSANTGSGPDNSYDASLQASWDVDLWGKIRRDVEAGNASLAASEDDLAAARLSARSSLAQDYFQLRVLDSQRNLYDDTIAAYQRAFDLVQNQFNAGIVTRADVTTAQTTLKAAQSSRLSLDVSRAKLEHAIALLAGEPASSFSLEPARDALTLPAIPVSVPSAILERRPDVSAAEHRVAAANAEIGVAKAAWFPALSLTASGGFQSNNFADWFTVPARVWSLGPSLAQTLFDGGARRAASDKAIATFDASVATYKQTVLTSFQEVEDYLATLRILENQAQVQDETVALAKQSTDLFLNQYKAGIVSYSTVVTAQATQLTAQRSALDIQSSRLTAAVQLIAALGGGWHEGDSSPVAGKDNAGQVVGTVPPG